MTMTTKGAVTPGIDLSRIPGPLADALRPLFLDPAKIAADVHNSVIKPSSKPTLPVGVSVMLTNEGGYLLMGRRKNNTASGLWSTPGGRLEESETIQQCAAREFFEETGATIDPLQVEIIGFREHFRYGGHYIMFYVHATSYAGTIENTEPDKCEGWTFKDMCAIREAETTEPKVILRRLNAIVNNGVSPVQRLHSWFNGR